MYEEDMGGLREENAKLKQEIERLKTCPDCGGTGTIVMCDDPYYAEPCVCTVDWQHEAMKMAEERNKLREERDSQQRVCIREMEKVAALLECLQWYGDEESYVISNFTDYDVEPVVEDGGKRARECIAKLGGCNDGS